MSPAPDDRQVTLHHALVDALHGDAFVRFELDPGTLDTAAMLPGQAVAWVGTHRSGVRWATALAADPHDAAHIAAAAELLVGLGEWAEAGGAPLIGVTITRGGRALLPPHLQQAEAWEWDFWWLDHEPPTDALLTAYDDGAAVTDLAADDPRIGPLLDLASPSAPLRPGDPRVVRWAAIEDPEGGLQDTGGLAAVLAVTRQRSGADHLNDVATHPDRRGRRLARLLCGQVAVDSLRAGAPAVTLGMYADNDAARALYAALGFTWVRGQTSGRLAPPATTTTVS